MPTEQGHLQVSDHHSLYWQVSGNPQGKPILFVHGGPGGHTKPDHLNLFDLQKWRVILLDQRGCGLSTPHGSLKDNTTWDLLSDMEKLREYLHIDQWTLYGTSWGTTLSLIYAITHPTKVSGLILRGIFLATQKEQNWVYKSGANNLFPKEWEIFINYLPQENRENLIDTYHKLLQEGNEEAAYHWSRWHLSLCRHLFNEEELEKALQEDNSLTGPLFETFYFKNQCFLEEDDWIIQHITPVKKIPTTIIHGRYDTMCPMDSAWRLKNALPEAKMIIIPTGGHATSEEPTLSTVIETIQQN